MAQLLSESEIKSRAATISGWNVDRNSLKCTRKFKDFIAAIEFVNKLVEPAEAAGHHPDIYISYNTVNISLSTHDAGGLTEKDFELAAVISQIS
jgi:4a-hydroxytetrahydrobiopterin dehydratase